jgi:phage baseplate assembly protein W
MATPIYYFDISKKGRDLVGNRDLPLLTNEQAVKESIYNILLTEVGTKIMDPQYGINLERYLFQPIDGFSSEAMQYDIYHGIRRFEDRISNLVVTVVPFEDESSYWITIDFEVVFSNTTQTLKVDFTKIR